MKNTKLKKSIIFNDASDKIMEYEGPPPEEQDWSGNLDDLFDIPPEIMALGWGIVTLENWQWMAGMSAFERGHSYHTERVRAVTKKGTYLSELPNPYDPANYLPVLNDPATKGCLLHLVREKIGANVSPVETSLGWILPKVIEDFHPTEAHVLAAALREDHE